MVLAYATADMSGGQINCAVTFGLVLAGKETPQQGVANFFAQMMGSIVGAGLLLATVTGDKNTESLGVSSSIVRCTFWTTAKL